MVQSIHRAFDILAALAVEPAGLTELARRTGLPKSTTSRLLATLQDLKAVERSDDTGLYRLGSTLNSLAGSSSNTDLASLATPHLHNLTVLTSETSGISIPDGYRVHYLTQVDSDNPIQIRDWSGELIPMHAVPDGQIYMSEWPDERLARYFSLDPMPFTSATITTEKAMRKRLDRYRGRGYTWVKEEFVEGLNSVAAPVKNQGGHIVAAMHVYGPAYRFPVDGTEKGIGESVVKAADRLSRSIARSGLTT
ncbi:MAG: IclR family transcriptional regulator [Acidimicrobiia bacterium]|nr:IclR family transcriptional regulator [Acidimicrobiia bacterium]